MSEYTNGRTLTVHLFRPETVHSDEHGEYGQVWCGWKGGYATSKPENTTCAECRRVIPARY